MPPAKQAFLMLVVSDSVEVFIIIVIIIINNLHHHGMELLRGHLHLGKWRYALIALIVVAIRRDIAVLHRGACVLATTASLSLACLELVHTCCVVVFLHIEFANWTGGASFKEPLIDAVFVEKVETRHGPQIVIRLVLDKTYHTLCQSLVFSLVLGCLNLCLCDLSEWETVYDGLGCGLA